MDCLWCRDCYRNIAEGVIPKLKWEREGIFHDRKLKKVGGRAYCSVYMIAENKVYLEEYHQKD